MTNTFDAIVIGSGQAGPALAVRLASAGIRTALIEREHIHPQTSMINNEQAA